MHTRQDILCSRRRRRESLSLSLCLSVSSFRDLEYANIRVYWYSSLPPFLPNYAARVIFEKSVSVCRGARALYVDRDITRQQQLLSPIAFQYSCSRGERERMLAETGGQLSRCIIQKSSKRNIAAAFLRIPSYSRLLFAETTSALFRKLAARKQIVPRSEPRGNTRLVYCIHIHANNCNNSATRVIDTRVSDYRVNGSLVFSLSFFSFLSISTISSSSSSSLSLSRQRSFQLILKGGRFGRRVSIQISIGFGSGINLGG